MLACFATILGEACAPGAKLERAALPPGVTYTFDGGVSFRMDHPQQRARIATPGAVYDLQLYRSCIGRKDTAPEVASIEDEGRAVLVGAGGGPFRVCLESRGERPL